MNLKGYEWDEINLILSEYLEAHKGSQIVLSHNGTEIVAGVWDGEREAPAYLVEGKNPLDSLVELRPDVENLAPLNVAYRCEACTKVHLPTEGCKATCTTCHWEAGSYACFTECK